MTWLFIVGFLMLALLSIGNSRETEPHARWHPILLPSKTFILIFAAVTLSATISTVAHLRISGLLSLHTQFVAAVVIAALNLMVAFAGARTRYRRAWLSCMLLGLISFLVFSCATPIGAALTLIDVAVRRILS